MKKNNFKKLKVIKLQSSSFTARVAEYHDNAKLEDNHKEHKITMQEVIAGKYTVEELFAQLTVKEMANMAVGKVTKKVETVVGLACASVPGAAGEASCILENRGVISLVLADGPAGLRLMPHFRADTNGNMRKGGDIYSDIVTPFEDSQPDDIDWYQYCTAIPITTMHANSWDMEMLEEMGKIVGSEMKRFNVHCVYSS